MYGFVTYHDWKDEEKEICFRNIKTISFSDGLLTIEYTEDKYLYIVWQVKISRIINVSFSE